MEVQASVTGPSHKINRASATNPSQTNPSRIQEYEVLGPWVKTIGEERRLNEGYSGEDIHPFLHVSCRSRSQLVGGVGGRAVCAEGIESGEEHGKSASVYDNGTEGRKGQSESVNDIGARLYNHSSVLALQCIKVGLRR